MACEQFAVADAIAELIGPRDQRLAVHIIVEHVLLDFVALRIVERAVRLPLELRELLLVGLAHFVARDFDAVHLRGIGRARSRSS